MSWWSCSQSSSSAGSPSPCRALALQNEVQAPRILPSVIRALCTDLVTLVVDVEGVRVLSCPSHLLGCVVTVDVARIRHALHMRVQAPADGNILKFGDVCQILALDDEVQAPRILMICPLRTDLLVIMVDMEPVRILPGASNLRCMIVTMHIYWCFDALGVRFQRSAAANLHHGVAIICNVPSSGFPATQDKVETPLSIGICAMSTDLASFSVDVERVIVFPSSSDLLCSIVTDHACRLKHALRGML
mmetsp:Transcript_69604/g.123178  ORF Transcript_69604/g.123178 Transcript_69604/m.123178 type:complete len:247 (+) Transcript_69604:111-851(+)